MAGRWPLVVGVTTIIAVVAWFLLRDDDLSTPAARPPAGDGSSGLTRREPAVSAPAGPRLGSDVEWGTEAERPELPPATPATPSADGTFEAQARDDGWARRTEADLQKRMKNIRGGKLDDIECRETMCRIIVIGSEAEVAKTVDELESPRGLSGYAKSLLLTAPERKPDGSIVLRLYPRFDR
jgi:hypothetical protein